MFGFRADKIKDLQSLATDAVAIVKSEYSGRVWSAVGVRSRLIDIFAKSAGLNQFETKMIHDAFALRSFANEQGTNITHLRDLANILIENHQTISDIEFSLSGE